MRWLGHLRRLRGGGVGGSSNREDDIICRNLDPGQPRSIKDKRLLLSGDPTSGFPTLDCGGGLAEKLGHLSDAAQAVEECVGPFHGCRVYDNIAQSATAKSTILSHGLNARNPRQCGVETFNEKLKALRVGAGLSVRKMADALDMKHSTYAAYEDPAKFKKPIIPLDFAKKIAAILEPLGAEKRAVMALAGLTGELDAAAGLAPPNPEADEWLTVKGSVAAGVWKEQTDWPQSEQYSVRFGPSSHPKSKRFAVRMDGLSMNRTIQPGADLECLYIKFSPVPPMPGDLVIVERKVHDLVELTCKRLSMEGDDYILLCESYEPEFQEPIPIGRPDQYSNTDDEVAVIGIVLSAKLDLAPKGLSQRRYHRR